MYPREISTSGCAKLYPHAQIIKSHKMICPWICISKNLLNSIIFICIFIINLSINLYPFLEIPPFFKNPKIQKYGFFWKIRHFQKYQKIDKKSINFQFKNLSKKRQNFDKKKFQKNIKKSINFYSKKHQQFWKFKNTLLTKLHFN